MTTTTLDTPVPLLQHHGEFAELLDLYRTTQPKRVLEVGTYHGGTLYHWLQNATPGTLVVSVDRYDLVDNTHLYPDWCPPDVTYEVIRGDSNDLNTVLVAAAYSPYDWIYIDADHTEPAVRRDWQNYRELAAHNATIVFHDISPSNDPSLQVAPLWNEIRDTHTTREIASNDGWGIGIIHLGSA